MPLSSRLNDPINSDSASYVPIGPYHGFLYFIEFKMNRVMHTEIYFGLDF